MNFESNWLQREPGEVIAQHRGIEGGRQGTSPSL